MKNMIMVAKKGSKKLYMEAGEAVEHREYILQNGDVLMEASVEEAHNLYASMEKVVEGQEAFPEFY